MALRLFLVISAIKFYSNVINLSNYVDCFLNAPDMACQTFIIVNRRFRVSPTERERESGPPAGIASGGENPASKEAALFQRLYAGAKRLMDSESAASKARENSLCYA
jgi:hypothetical protein